MTKPSVSSRFDAMDRLERDLFKRGNPSSPRVIQITSSNFGEGVTSVTLGLANSIARLSGSDSIVVVEANLRKPSLHERLGVIPIIPMLNLLERGSGALHAVIKIEKYGFSVLPAGATPIEGVYRAEETNLRKPSSCESLRTIPMIPVVDSLERDSGAPDSAVKTEKHGVSDLPLVSTPIEGGEIGCGLCLDNLEKLVDELRSRYNFILLDSPPVIPFPDSDVVAGFSDAVVIVVEANATTAEILDVTIDRLRAVEGHIAGMILNKREFHIPKWLFRLV